MLSISDALKTIYKNDYSPAVSELADKDLVIYFPLIDLTIDTLIIVDDSFELDEGLLPGDELVFGSCRASQIKFTIADVSQDLTGLEFTINQIVNGIYTMPLGIFKVESCKKQDDAWFKDIVAYDRMKLIDTDVATWYNGLAFPLNLASFRTSLLTYLGLTETTRTLPNDSMTVTKTIEPSQISGRVVLEACEEINGAFGHIGRDGKFSHIVLKPAHGLHPSKSLRPSVNLHPINANNTSYVQPGTITETITKDMCQSVKFEEYSVKEIDNLIIRQEEDDVGAIVGTGTNAYVIEGNFLVFGKSADELAVIAKNAYGNMKQRHYRPYQSDSIGLPYAEVGDMLAFENGDTVTGYMLQRTLTGIQALRDAYEAPGSEKREQNFGVNKEIIQLQSKSAVIKKTVEELSQTVTDLASGTQTKFTQTDETISLEAVRAVTAENTLSGSISVLAGEVELKVDASGVIAAINLSPGTAKISADKISLEGYVTITNLGTDGAVEIDGGNLKAGTVIADTVRASWVYAGKVIADNIESGGTIQGVTFKSIGESGNVNISNGTITITDNYGNQSIMNGNAFSIYSMLVRASLNVLGAASIERLSCNNVNGGTPITSSNIGQQTVSSAASASYATSAGSTASASYATSAGSAPLSSDWQYAVKTNVGYLASQMGKTLPASWPA